MPEPSDNNRDNRDNGLGAPDYEFNLWTKHDCHGTEYQNNNRTWFHFGVGYTSSDKKSSRSLLLKLNLVNLNKQMKMFSQGMCPVFKVVPGQPHWERVRDKLTYRVSRANRVRASRAANNLFITLPQATLFIDLFLSLPVHLKMDDKGVELSLSFSHRLADNPKSPAAITYFAFTYPFAYDELQRRLDAVDRAMGGGNGGLTASSLDDVYYHRECAIRSLEGRRLDLLTVTSRHGITTEREDRLANMFPEGPEGPEGEKQDRPFKFNDKRVVLLSARVHPGETPSSFVLDGFLSMILDRDDPVASSLRRLYVFKLIPMLNPDGVARGHYRMDTRGVNLNRVYLDPSPKLHPTIYAAHNLIRFSFFSFTSISASQFAIAPFNVNIHFAGLQVLPPPLPVATQSGQGREGGRKIHQGRQQTRSSGDYA